MVESADLTSECTTSLWECCGGAIANVFGLGEGIGYEGENLRQFPRGGHAGFPF